jgi:phenylpyruvate tautomerase PptA (4-oxalocrotonate tautomerase family)
MPHVIVKLWRGKSKQQKIRLAEEIVKDLGRERRNHLERGI